MHCDWIIQVGEYISALRTGLSRYCRRPTPIACFVQVCIPSEQDNNIWVFDPDDLLSRYKNIFREYFGSKGQWPDGQEVIHLGEDRRFELPAIPGIVGNARAVMTTAFDGIAVAAFASPPPELKCTGPLRTWLDLTAGFLAAEIVSRRERHVAPPRVNLIETVCSFARQAVSQYALELCELPGESFENLAIVGAVLHSVVSLSATAEEHELPEGALLVMLGQCVKGNELVSEFRPPYPSLNCPKHVGKVLRSVSCASDCCLIIDNRLDVIGVATIPSPQPQNSVLAKFNSGKVQVSVGGEHVCDVLHSELIGSDCDVQLHVLNQALTQHIQGDDLTKLCERASNIVREVRRRRHGCTLVLDCRAQPRALSGQQLSRPLPIDPEKGLSVAAGMSAIDGALHIDKSGNLIAFGCLLDGKADKAEVRARGARYNSALRFARDRDNSGAIVVVLSEDGYTSVFSEKGEITVTPSLASLEYEDALGAITLDEWRSPDGIVQA
jgi:hypothetical protein